MRAAHRRVAAGIAVLAAMVTLAACGSEDVQRPAEADLKIGDLVPRTGFLDQFGEPAQQAADLAADEIRKAAAKAGAQHKVTVTHVDYRSKPVEAVKFAGKLVERARVAWSARGAGARSTRVATKVAIPRKVLQIVAGGQRRCAVEGRGPRVPEPGRAAGPAPGARARGAARRQARGGVRGKKVNVGALESTTARS